MNLQVCVMCGSDRLHLEKGREELRIGERKATVDVESFRCENCGESVFTPAQLRAAQVGLVEELRRREQLLAPAHIKGIRQRHSLTQAGLEQLLGVAPKTVVRWERGTVCQSRALDQLLRLVEIHPRGAGVPRSTCGP